MPNGIWNKETYMMGVPNEENFKTLGNAEQLETIFENVLTIKKIVLNQPAICQEVMDKKIITNNKISRKFNLGLSGLGAGGIVGLIEGIKSLFGNG